MQNVAPYHPLPVSPSLALLEGTQAFLLSSTVLPWILVLAVVPRKLFSRGQRCGAAG